MLDGAFAYSFAAGMVAVANPCAFALLPAYLSFFLGVDGAEGGGSRASLSRALAVGLSVSAGFAATFAVLGIVVDLSSRVVQWTRWLSVLIGIGLVVLGALLLTGRELSFRLPRLDKGGRSGALRSMVLYGVSYAVVSIGCTAPIFLAVVGGALSVGSLPVFGAYIAGFTVLLTGLTVAIALARQGLVRAIRRALPYIQRISGALLVVAGAYVAWYGYRTATDLGASDPIIDQAESLQSRIRGWIEGAGTTTLGILLALLIAGAAVFVASKRSRDARA